MDFGDGLEEINQAINAYFGRGSLSRHQAVVNCIALFNRFSEEYIDPNKAIGKTEDEVLKGLLCMYQRYLDTLANEEAVPRMDFSLMQQEALKTLQAQAGSGDVFKHVIIDEYQDLNACELEILQRLAKLGVSVLAIGDDDQSIYSFRKAHPAGIRRFLQDFATDHDYKLTICHRSPRRILGWASHVRPPEAGKPRFGLV